MDGSRRTRRRNHRRAPERLGGAEALDGAQSGAAEAREDLHVCPRCASELVQPREWAPAEEEGRWRIELRCPECEWTDSGVFTQRRLDHYDEILDDGAAALVQALHELAEENMRADVERLAAAIDSDLILPEDF